MNDIDWLQLLLIAFACSIAGGAFFVRWYRRANQRREFESQISLHGSWSRYRGHQ